MASGTSEAAAFGAWQPRPCLLERDAKKREPVFREQSRDNKLEGAIPGAQCRLSGSQTRNEIRI
ncbi:hypothetical protein GCM10010862_24060 [Devosia nitrariae]|uniref:Uncharacterized protein n=1 Tax=Devosia nitrariae TaxID=2071872 RepID=A0ABQ5W5K0_9HYPH|nr:hypothetical protein GCM10010862_24060 [Devosia nitrariae]